MSRKSHVEVRVTLEGEPARILRDLIERGIACKHKDAISQALISYYDEVLDREIKARKVREARDGPHS